MIRERTTILVVDDNKDDYITIKRSFRGDDRDFEILWAQLGEDALETLKSGTVDIVMLDYNLPGMTGLELFDEIRSMEIDVPVIFVTGSGNERVAVDAIKRGAHDYFVKDFRGDYVNLLPAVVEKTLRQWQDRQARIKAEQEQRRLEILEKQQRTFTEALHDITISLTSSLDLDTVLDRILDNIDRVVPYKTANLCFIKDDKASLLRFRGLRESVSYNSLRDLARNLPLTPTWRMVIETRHPVTIPDIRDMPEWEVYPGFEWIRSYLAAPIVLNEVTIGIIALSSDMADFFGPDQALRLQSFANTAGVAIQNAQLFQRAKQVAILEERNRLARDLHDSLSQTLFSARSIAEALPRLMQSKPEKVKGYLHDLVDLTQGATSEMRSLLLELRPESLIESDLVTLINQLCDSFTLRTATPVIFDGPPNLRLPEKEQLAFYRMTQESLNNIIKYARAQEVHIELIDGDGAIELRIRDDGKGFDLDAIPAGHLGIQMMRERADEIDAELKIIAEPGKGTEIRLKCSIRWL